MSTRSNDEARPATATVLEGYVERLSRQGAEGWAWMRAFPGEVVQVEAVIDGKVIGRTSATLLRPDLLKRNYGTGRYGFEMTFTEAIVGDRAPTLRALVADEIIDLPGKYALSEGESASAAPQSSAIGGASSPADGYVEKMTRQGARGWAWSPASPRATVRVEAQLDGKVIGSVEASSARLDLALRHIGTGNYGFVLLFDSLITGEKAPTLFIADKDSRTRLHGNYDLPSIDLLDHAAEKRLRIVDGGRRTAPLVPQADGHVDSLTRRGARGWAWLPSAPNTTMEVEAVFDGRVIGRASAEGERTDLVARGLGTGRYGFSMSFVETVMGDRAPDIRVLVPSASQLPGARTLPAATEADLTNLPRGSMTAWSKEHAAWTTRGPHYEEFDSNILADVPRRADQASPLLMAFYLPQFHPIPENNQFWGTGFTEWRQLTRGVSRFPGHYQPRIPRDLGFYDLTNIDILRAQAALAKAAGVNAFSYYYYWFNGKRLLERPLDMLMKSDVDMPFTILWANENWTRTWDGSDSEVLVKQDYRREDESSLLADLARHFLDARYVCLDGRPLFFIYNPANIPDTRATVQRWRSTLSSRYEVEPLFFMAQTFGARDPKDYGFDGAMEFPPHKTAERLVGRLTPDAYSAEYKGHLIAYDDFVAAWNEWAEAAYLEPDVHYGASYLNATARAYASIVNEMTMSQLRLF